MVYVEGEWGMCLAPTRRMTKVRLSNGSPQWVVIRHITPEYQYLWFCFYCPSLFPAWWMLHHLIWRLLQGHQCLSCHWPQTWQLWPLPRHHWDRSSSISLREGKGELRRVWHANLEEKIIQFLFVEFVLTYKRDPQLGLQLLLPAEFWQLDAGDALVITIGSPEWQLRESHSLKHGHMVAMMEVVSNRYPAYLAYILGFWDTCGIKMMSLRHDWGWQSPQTAFCIHIGHIQSVFDYWYAVHG